jgi:hypothetical protein
VSALGQDPVQQKRPSLAGSFGLKRTAVPAPAPDTADDEPTPVTSLPMPVALPEPMPAREPEPVQQDGAEIPEYQAPTVLHDSRKADKGLTLRMPRSLFLRFRERKERDGISYPNLMFTAVSKTHKRLPELLAASTIDLSNDADNLFDLPTAVSKLSDHAKEATEDLPIRVTARNIQVLDTLKETYNAPSRNHLINTCIDAYLEESP